MDLFLEAALSGAVGAVLGAVIGAVVVTLGQRYYEQLKLRQDVIRRLMANRHIIINSGNNNNIEELRVTLNESFIVYADFKDVISALRTLHRGSPLLEDRKKHFVDVIKKMAKAARVNINNLNDSDFTTIF